MDLYGITNSAIEVINFIRVALAAIIISLIFYFTTNGFINDVTTLRLTKISFKLTAITIINLWIAYFISTLIMIFIYYYFPMELHPTRDSILQADSIMLISLFIIYLGRIITKFEGKSLGRAYFTTIIIFGLIDLIIELGSINFSIFSTLVPYSLDKSIEIVNFLGPLIIWLAVGTFLLASLGELILSSMRSSNSESYINLMKSIEYPSGGRILDSSSQIIIALKTLLINKDIKVIKCLSRSLWIAAKIDEINCENNLRLDVNKFFIIKMPDWLAQVQFAKEIMSRYPTLNHILGKNSAISQEYSEIYHTRRSILKKYNMKDWDIGDLRLIIIEYIDGQKRMIILAKNMDFEETIVGLYSEDPLFIEKYSDYFDKIWAIAVPAF